MVKEIWSVHEIKGSVPLPLMSTVTLTLRLNPIHFNCDDDLESA